MSWAYGIAIGLCSWACVLLFVGTNNERIRSVSIVILWMIWTGAVLLAHFEVIR